MHARVSAAGGIALMCCQGRSFIHNVKGQNALISFLTCHGNTLNIYLAAAE
jgi:hypothetical protein